jgi:O-antigen/teichoic acid export membrane protein
MVEKMKESSVKKNIVANFAGKAWASIMSLVFIPLYIKFMGIEAYGLIGIFVSLIAILAILDMGLSSTLSRELARLSTSEDTAQESKDLVRTMEFV